MGLHGFPRTFEGSSRGVLPAAFVVVLLSYVAMIQGCTDPNTPEFLNPHDGSSEQYRPAAPTSLALTNLTERSRLLTWQRNSTDESGFTIERRSGPTGTFEVIGHALTGSVVFLDTGSIVTDRPYTYRVTAYAANGHSSSHDSLTFVLQFPVPSGLRVEASTHDSVWLAWSDTSRFAEGYIVERRTREHEYDQVAAVPAGITRWADRPPDTLSDYSYRIRGYSSLNIGAAGNTAGVIFTPVIGPPEIVASVVSEGAGGISSVVSHDGRLMMTIWGQRRYAVFDGVRRVFLWGRDKEDLGASAFSGDDQVFAFHTTDRTLHIVRLSDGQETKTISSYGFLSQSNHMALNEDGSALAYSDGHNFSVFDTRTGVVILKVANRLEGITWLEFSPDGKVLACAIGSGVELWDVPGATLMTVLPGDGSEEYVRFGAMGILASTGGAKGAPAITFWDLNGPRKLSSARAYLFTDTQGGFDADAEQYVAVYQEGYQAGYRLGLWRVRDGVQLTSISLGPRETFPRWDCISSVYSGSDAIVTIEYDGTVRERRLASEWAPRDW